MHAQSSTEWCVDQKTSSRRCWKPSPSHGHLAGHCRSLLSVPNEQVLIVGEKGDPKGHYVNGITTREQRGWIFAVILPCLTGLARWPLTVALDLASATEMSLLVTINYASGHGYIHTSFDMLAEFSVQRLAHSSWSWFFHDVRLLIKLTVDGRR